MSEGLINIMFYLTYIGIFLAAAGLLFGVGVAIFQNMKDGGLFALAGLSLVLVLFVIGYVLSPSEMPANLLSKGIDGLGAFKFSSAGLFTFYALAIVAVILVAVDIVKGIIDGQ
jgi:hypothetical protein